MTIIWLVEKAQNWKSSLLRLVSPVFPVRTFTSVAGDQDCPQPVPGSPGCLLVNEDSCKEEPGLITWSEKLARQHGLPAVFLSEKYGSFQSIKDLCRKPGEMTELFIRLSSGCQPAMLIQLLRSLEQRKHLQNVLRFKDLEYDQESMQIRFTGDPETTCLTPKEARILRLFMLHPGRCWSRPELREQVWNGLRVSPRTIDSQISRLRKKLRYSGISIENKYGDGYIFG